MAETKHDTVFDTGQQYLGSVYAKALLASSENAGETEAVMEGLQSIVDDVLEQAPGLEATLISPRVPLEAKETMLQTAFAKKAAPTLLTFLKVLCRRGRFDCLRAILRAARKQYNDLRGRIEIQVSTADPLSAEDLKTTTNQLRGALGCEVDVQVKIVPELIGGIVIRVGDTVYDGSLANRLKQLRNDMVAKSIQQIRSELDRFAAVE
jgi:F-type H+-transporting ATPase subunit delta